MEQPTPIQISPGQLQSELESIRSLRRISLSQSSNDLDPDLPSSLQIDMNNPEQLPSLSPSTTDSSTIENEEPNPNLFWLPARLHPEIAPQEFKAFIEEATKPENLLRRTSSALGSRRNSSDHLSPSRLSRKKSMLSQVYDPTKNPNPLPPLISSNSNSTTTTTSSTTSTSSSSSSSQHRPEKAAITRGYSMSSPRNLGRGAQGLESLTINDLQRLESLVLKKPPSTSNDPSSLDSQFHHLNLNDDRIRAVISRSMSIGGSASLPSGPEFNPEQLDPEAIDDSPLISRAPGHIIRRTARTKVRKTSLPGDGNGHRFPATRRTQVKSSMANSQHPRTASTTSNDSEETVSNDLHSNRSSKELNQKSILNSSDDLTLTIEPHHLHPAPPTGAKSSNSATILDPPSEDDQSLDSNSRPDSLASNNSLLDAYTYEGVTLNDHLAPAVDSGDVDFSNLTVSPSALDFTIPHPIKYAGPTSDHSHPTGSVQTPKPDSIGKPPSLDPSHLSPPGSTKPESLKVLTDLAAPVPYRTTRSSEELPSTSASSSPAISSSTTTTLSTAKSTPSSGITNSPPTPVGPQSSRPPLPTTQTSPNLSNPATSTTPAPPTSSKEGKEKKRAWVKLGLASAVSTSSKSKKGKAKDKQKFPEAEGGPGGAPSNVSASSSGGSGSTGTTAGGGVVKKESGFLSGLFGGKSRKNESEQPDKQGSSSSGGSGPAGSPTKHLSPGPGGGPTSGDTQAQHQLMNPTASGGYIKGRFMSFYRLPIHVERAVYRLSHIKLANPRRPLYEQVLISNLMFWYLGVINKSQPAPLVNHGHHTQPILAHSPSPTPSPPSSSSSTTTTTNPPIPSTNNRNTKQGNGRKSKTNSGNNSSSSNQRGPGVKTRGKQNKAEAERTNGKLGAGGRGTVGHKKTQPGRQEGVSSGSGSEADESTPTTTKQARVYRSSSSSSDDDDSSDSHQSSDHDVVEKNDNDDDDDDDEKPLGNRIRALNNIPRTIHNSSPHLVHHPSNLPSIGHHRHHNPNLHHGE